MQDAFIYRSPASKVVFRAGALDDLARELAELGVEPRLQMKPCRWRLETEP